MTNASARPPRVSKCAVWSWPLGLHFPDVLSMLWASGPRGSTLAYPLSCRSGWFQTCLLSPTWPPAVSHLQMLSGCFGLHLPPTCLPTSHSMLWMLWPAWFYACTPLVSNWAPLCLQEYCGFWAAQFYTYVPLVSHLSPTVSQYAVGALHFSRTVSTDTLDVLCRMNLRLSAYCLQISCGCSGLQEATLVSLLFSTVSQNAVVTERCSVGA